MTNAWSLAVTSRLTTVFAGEDSFFLAFILIVRYVR